MADLREGLRFEAKIHHVALEIVDALPRVITFHAMNIGFSPYLRRRQQIVPGERAALRGG